MLKAYRNWSNHILMLDTKLISVNIYDVMTHTDAPVQWAERRSWLIYRRQSYIYLTSGVRIRPARLLSYYTSPALSQWWRNVGRTSKTLALHWNCVRPWRWNKLVIFHTLALPSDLFLYLSRSLLWPTESSSQLLLRGRFVCLANPATFVTVCEIYKLYFAIT